MKLCFDGYYCRSDLQGKVDPDAGVEEEAL